MLDDRRVALEEAFFRKENERLRERLRAERERESTRRALAGEVGLEDKALLDRLVELGIRVDTVEALVLVPLAMVAWADGKMDAREREAVLRGAEASGIAPGSPAYQLLDTWTIAAPAARADGLVARLHRGAHGGALGGSALGARGAHPRPCPRSRAGDRRLPRHGERVARGREPCWRSWRAPSPASRRSRARARRPGRVALREAAEGHDARRVVRDQERRDRCAPPRPSRPRSGSRTRPC